MARVDQSQPENHKNNNIRILFYSQESKHKQFYLFNKLHSIDSLRKSIPKIEENKKKTMANSLIEIEYCASAQKKIKSEKTSEIKITHRIWLVTSK